MRGSVYTPPRVYQPNFFHIGSHDTKYTDRIGVSIPNSNTAWVSGLGVYVPIVITVPSTIYEWWWVNGTLTTAHNLDFGLYNMDFTKIQSLGSTAGATTASVIVNTTTWTNLDVAPGQYYMAFCDDSTRNLATSADALGLYQAAGVMEQTGLSSTLPSPAVPVAYTRAFLPLFGMNLYTVALG
jgi:hypothetical protein